MTPFLQFDIALIIIITLAKLGGYLSYKLGQPSVLGELLVGIILGPTLIDFLHLPFFTDEHLAETIAHLAELGVLLLMFIAGLDLHLTDLLKSGKVSALAGVLGVIVPLTLGTLVGILFQMDFLSAFFMGLVLSATSVSISAQTLMELNVLRNRVGISLLGAAVFDDILVILGLSVFVAVLQAGADINIWNIVLIFVQMVVYLGVALGIGIWLMPKLSYWVEDLPISRGLIAFAFVICLLYAWAAEALGGMAAITGAFLAGLMFARTRVKEYIESGIGTLAYAVFVPIFFVNVGLSANARELTLQSLLLLIVMVVVAIIGKVLGAGGGAKLAGLTNLESLQLGVGMMSRGEVGLIVASVGILEGVISQQIFSAVVGVVIVTTLLTPVLLRSLFARNKVIREKA